MQADTKTWMDILERFGWPTLILVVFALVVWQLFKKYFWPLVLKQQAALEAQQVHSDTQLQESRAAREQERKEFLMSLNNVVAENRAATVRLAESIDGIRDEVRRTRG